VRDSQLFYIRGGKSGKGCSDVVPWRLETGKPELELVRSGRRRKGTLGPFRGIQEFSGNSRGGKDVSGGGYPDRFFTKADRGPIRIFKQWLIERPWGQPGTLP